MQSFRVNRCRLQYLIYYYINKWIGFLLSRPDCVQNKVSRTTAVLHLNNRKEPEGKKTPAPSHAFMNATARKHWVAARRRNELSAAQQPLSCAAVLAPRNTMLNKSPGKLDKRKRRIMGGKNPFRLHHSSERISPFTSRLCYFLSFSIFSPFFFFLLLFLFSTTGTQSGKTWYPTPLPNNEHLDTRCFHPRIVSIRMT